MDIYEGLDNLDSYENIVMALGNFDGVHLGHRELVKRTIEIAGDSGGVPAVLTFDPHPMKVLQPETCPPMLLTKEDKIRILADLGIKLLIIAPFSEGIYKLTPEQFIHDILVHKFRVKAVVVGYNYNFGSKGAGNSDTLRTLAAKYGFTPVVVPPVKLGDREVSSTAIRQLLMEGNVAEAAGFLGYPPFVTSRVVQGDRRGRTMGFPTANLDLPPDLLVPAVGVYAVRVSLQDRVLDGVANIGVKPTFNTQQPKNLEVHIFDFNETIYNARIKVEFIEMIRSEKGFPSMDDLVRQIEQDARSARHILQRMA